MIAPMVDRESSSQWLKEKCGELWALKQECDRIERDLELAKERRNNLEKEIQEKMEDEGFLRVDTEDCFVTLSDTTYVTVPKSHEQKQKLFEWLKRQGEEVFMDYATVNYQRLNSLYKQEKENGNVLPGAGPEKVRTKFSVYGQKRRRK